MWKILIETRLELKSSECVHHRIMQNYISFKYPEAKIKRTTCCIIWFSFRVFLRVDAVISVQFRYVVTRNCYKRCCEQTLGKWFDWCAQSWRGVSFSGRVDCRSERVTRYWEKGFEIPKETTGKQKGQWGYYRFLGIPGRDRSLLLRGERRVDFKLLRLGIQLDAIPGYQFFLLGTLYMH